MSTTVHERLYVLQSLEKTIGTCQFPTKEDLPPGQYTVALNTVLQQKLGAACVMVRELKECIHAQFLEHEAIERESSSELKPVDRAGGNGDQ